ncbi:RelE/StbE replicon stabilization toxin [uncultured Candidatus Thioglobus sp.]|nr:RelE/StbE replicon stabilization toxin [uncultured Candidatus Thioglobus sp.]
MQYLIEFRPSTIKELKRISKRDLIKIRSKIESLSDDPKGINTTKLKGNNSFYRIRSGNYRVIYEIRDNKLIVLVVKVGHRSDVYKRL